MCERREGAVSLGLRGLLRRAAVALECILALWIAALIPTAPALAHSPYYGDTAAISVPQLGDLWIKLLYGDGIIAADPVRAVLVDADGRALAISPLADSLSLHCKTQQGGAECVVFDASKRQVYSLSLDWLARTPQRAEARVIEVRGAPTMYPDHLGEAYGFSLRAAGWTEALTFTAQRLAQEPMGFVLSVIWCVLVLWCLRPLSRLVLWLAGRGAREGATVWRIVLSALQIAGGTFMTLTTVLYLLVTPATGLGFALTLVAAFLMMLGGAVCWRAGKTLFS